MSFILGLTGSIGMGKTTTAQFFKKQSVPVFDADATVHDLYQNEAIDIIRQHFPESIFNGRVDRQLLGQTVLPFPEKLKFLEDLIHPLIQIRKQSFIRQNENKGKRLLILDVPLLLEKKKFYPCHGVVVVTAPEMVQKERILKRIGMTEEKMNYIIANQIRDSEKRKQAHFLIDTSRGFDAAEKQVNDILRSLVPCLS